MPRDASDYSQANTSDLEEPVVTTATATRPTPGIGPGAGPDTGPDAGLVRRARQLQRLGIDPACLLVAVLEAKLKEVSDAIDTMITIHE